MTDAQDWTIVFYLDDTGGNPVREFLESLDGTTQRRFAWSFEQLRVRNVHARYPLVRPVEGDLWELREESSTNIYRIFYLFFS
jgi:phage-related protein